MTDVEPKAIALGTTTTLTGSGDLDSDQAGGHFTMTMTGVGGVSLLHDCSGDSAVDKTCQIALGPIRVGTIKYGGVTFPQKAGHIVGVPQVQITLPKGLPSFALTTTTTLRATSLDGSPMMCNNIHTKA